MKKNGWNQIVSGNRIDRATPDCVGIEGNRDGKLNKVVVGYLENKDIACGGNAGVGRVGNVLSLVWNVSCWETA